MIIAIVIVSAIVLDQGSLITVIVIAIVSVIAINLISFHLCREGGKHETEICNKYIFFRCKGSIESKKIIFVQQLFRRWKLQL